MTAREYILGLLQSGPIVATNNKIACSAGVSIIAVNNALRKLEAEGKIERRKVGRNRQITIRP